MTRSAAPHGIHPSGTTAARRRDLHTASVQSAHPSQATPHGEPPSAIVIGDRCIDHNTVGRQALASTWGSPTLFIARHLRLEHGLRPVVSGPYASDLLPFLDEFACDQGPSGQRSLSYRNVVEPTRRTETDHVTDQQRVQYWRPADRPLQPIACQPPGGAFDLLYFCPLVPDHDRTDDIETIAAARQDRLPVRVLLAQGLMRTSGPTTHDVYRQVLRRDIDDDEAATWSCFDLVVFSDDDLTDALAKATRWSANDAARDTGFVVTQGPRGATLCHHGTATHIPTQPVADELAPVGAGDVFGATVGLEFHAAYVAEGMDRFGALLRAVARATEAASTYVGAGRTPTVPEPVIVRGLR